jgi:murein DD-endopeptidase MepM/ murein hydrolase activator NlpD
MLERTGRVKRLRARWRWLAAMLLLAVLGGVAAWRHRHTIAHIARLALQRRTLPDTPQNTAPQSCPDAPWLLPTSGILGVLWRDSRVPPYGTSHRHTGLDIFGEGRENTVPVYAVADGLLTRLPGWKSAVVIQHDDPLRPGEPVWTFYSHMASASGRKSYIADGFPPGSTGVPVAAGQLLGYQGVWSGHPLRPGWMHLHFSVVRAAEDGSFLNETVLDNTFDPSPYLGIAGNADLGQDNWQPLRCRDGTP